LFDLHYRCRLEKERLTEKVKILLKRKKRCDSDIQKASVMFIYQIMTVKLNFTFLMKKWISQVFVGV